MQKNLCLFYWALLLGLISDQPMWYHSLNWMQASNAKCKLTHHLRNVISEGPPSTTRTCGVSVVLSLLFVYWSFDSGDFRLEVRLLRKGWICVNIPFPESKDQWAAGQFYFRNVVWWVKWLQKALVVVKHHMKSVILLFVAATCVAASTSEFGMTPFGWMHKSCVHHVGDGAHITDFEGEVVIVKADGTRFVPPPCAYGQPTDDDFWNAYTSDQTPAGNSATHFDV